MPSKRVLSRFRLIEWRMPAESYFVPFPHPLGKEPSEAIYLWLFGIGDYTVSRLRFRDPCDILSPHARLELQRLAIALERYKAAKGDYPVTLDELVPAFLEEVPLDPFTGRKTLTYILAPDEETAFLLYSYGKNETDDGGDEGEDIVLRMIRR